MRPRPIPIMHFQREQRMNKDIMDYLNGIAGEGKRKDCLSLVKIIEEESGYEASLHGKIIGFGVHKYNHDGRTGEAVVAGFAPRTQDISIYVMSGCKRSFQDVLPSW